MPPDPSNSVPAAATFACPACGHAYRWKPEVVGRRVECRQCGEVFAAAAAAPAQPAAARSADALAAGARGGFARDPRYARRVATEAEETTVLHNWILPGIVLGLGLALRTWQAAAHASRYDAVPAWASFGLVALEWLAVSVALGGGVAAGAAIGVEVERPGPGVFKPIATALLLAGVAHVFAGFDRSAGDAWGVVIGVPFVFALVFFMFAAMYKADLMEGGLAAVIATVLACAAMFVLALNVGGEAGRVLGFGRPA